MARHSSGHIQGWITADGKALPCSDHDGIFGMIIDLIACYYAWDLTYPKKFQILDFLQEHVIGGRSSKFFKSCKFLQFEKRFLEAGSK